MLQVKMIDLLLVKDEKALNLVKYELIKGPEGENLNFQGYAIASFRAGKTGNERVLHSYLKPGDTT